MIGLEVAKKKALLGGLSIIMTIVRLERGGKKLKKATDLSHKSVMATDDES